MKTAKNVDGKFNFSLPSMKRAEIMDEKFIFSLPSMKTAENVDGRRGLWMRGWGMDRKCNERVTDGERGTKNENKGRRTGTRDEDGDGLA